MWNGLGDFSDNLVVWWVMMFMEVAGPHCRRLGGTVGCWGALWRLGAFRGYCGPLWEVRGYYRSYEILCEVKLSAAGCRPGIGEVADWQWVIA